MTAERRRISRSVSLLMPRCYEHTFVSSTAAELPDRVASAAVGHGATGLGKGLPGTPKIVRPSVSSGRSEVLDRGVERFPARVAQW